MELNPIEKIQNRIQAFAERSEFVFLLSHMRGYTSLLSHILGSHPEIKGYTEMHHSYRSNLGLIKLRYKSKLTTQSENIPRYLYDKILHDDYKVAGRILKRKNVRPIIMVREPIATMKSIINMGQNKTNVVGWYKEEDKVADYYINRLNTLLKYAKVTKGNTVFIEGQQLIDNTEEILASLTNYLELSEPLRKEYDTFTLTGTVAFGDTSEHIKKGKIVKKRSSYETILISQKNKDRTTRHYQNVIKELAHHCKPL